ncbi:MAG: hypothetical protein JW888_08275 [Pirellulales bacterium]|nr:hypothetical protein [Pirellulales bacterium]
MFACNRSNSLVLLGFLTLALSVPARGQAVGSPGLGESASAETAAPPQPIEWPAANVPADAAWYIQAHIERIAHDPFVAKLGQSLDKSVRDEILDKFRGAPPIDVMHHRVSEILGFDPLENVEWVTVYGMASPLDEMRGLGKRRLRVVDATGVVVVQLRGTTGNLEGLALATPDYESAEYKGATIHSGTVNNAPGRVFIAVLKRPEGESNLVVFGMSEDHVRKAVDQATNATPASSGSMERENVLCGIGMKLDEKTMRALNIPKQQSAAFKMLKATAAIVKTDDASLVIEIRAFLVDEQRAEQVRQLLEGLVAMAQLHLETHEGTGNDMNEDEKQLVSGMLETVAISRDGSRVTCRLSAPQDQLLRAVGNLKK